MININICLLVVCLFFCCFFVCFQEVVQSCSGMLTTVAYQMGPHATPTYALEGSVSDAGQSVKWLKENLQLFEEFSDIGEQKVGGAWTWM